ncbi:UNVERIFIED_CONTAM: hypothetical protein FKN15_039473 [Acipenser sinensis]
MHKGDDSRYLNAALFLNGRLPTVPGMNSPTIQYEARSSVRSLQFLLYSVLTGRERDC